MAFVLRPLAVAFLLLIVRSNFGLAQEIISSELLFEKPKSEGEYRIPGLIVIDENTVIAFCADRKGRGDFGHDTTTVMRRSVDGGKTWGPIKEITAHPKTDIHNGPVVYDQTSKRLFKFCRYWPAAGNALGFTSRTPRAKMIEEGWIDHVQTSDDLGASWSKPEPLVVDFPADAFSAATGNGVHGIQTEQGKLLIQGGYFLNTDKGKRRHCCIIASDDGGKSWKMSTDVDTEETATLREFVIGERDDNTVVMNIRSDTGKRFIYDGKKLQADDELLDVECHAGLAEGPQGRWFFTHPDPLGKERERSFVQRRQRMVLRISDDEGETWSKGFVVHKQAAGYSDVGVLPSGEVLVLFESGDKVGDPNQHITLTRVRLP